MIDTKLSRRRFLKGLGLASGLAAFPTIVPASVLGRGGRPVPSDRITMGFIGMGSQGINDMGAFLNKPETQVLAVCDVNREGPHYAYGIKGREPARQMVNSFYSEKDATYKGVDAYEMFEEVLSREDIDVVGIALPDHWHAYMAAAAAEAGKDMYSQKPLCRTIYEGQQMVKAIRKHDRVFQTGSQQRSDPLFRRACELVRNGYLGEIKEVWAAVGDISKPCPLGAEPVPDGFNFERWLGNAPEAPYHHERVSGSYSTDGGSWRSWRDYSAGRMSDWGAHNFDIGQWGLGMDESGPVEIVPPDGKEIQHLTFRYTNGIPMYNAQGPHEGMVNFIGTDGWVGVTRGKIWASDENLLTMDFKPSDIRLYASDDHYQDFLNCVQSRKRPIADVEIGHRSVTVCLLGEIAMRLNRPLKWDPVKEAFEDDDAEATALLTREMRGPWKV